MGRLFLLLAVALALGGGLAYASIPDQQGVIHGCYTKNGGQLRVVDTGKGAACTQFEAALNWSQTGPKGSTGPKGPTGLQGPRGPSGPAGPSDGFFTAPIGQDSLPLAPKVLASLSLKAGSYLIFASVDLLNQANGLHVAECWLADSGAISDSASAHFQAVGDRDVEPLVWSQTLNAPDTVELLCEGSGSNGDVVSETRQLAALRVATLQVQ